MQILEVNALGCICGICKCIYSREMSRKTLMDRRFGLILCLKSQIMCSRWDINNKMKHHLMYRYLFVCSGSLIKVYNTVSGECVRELVGHEGNVTGIAVHPKNRLQILTCSEDKSVIVWDYTDGIQLKSYPIERTLFGIFTCGHDDTIFLLATSKGVGQKGSLCTLIQKSLSDKGGKHVEVLHGCSSDLRCIAVGPLGKFFATVQRVKLTVTNLQGDKRHTVVHPIDDSQEFTCVTCHPKGNSIATGSIDGTIYLWYKFLSKGAIKSKLHWHSLPVKEISFTPEGSYLLSGGHECVLVKWHMNTEYRDFLPRLGAPISHLASSLDNQLYAIGQDDNVIQVVRSSFEVTQVFQGLTRSDTGTIPTGLRCDPRTQALVLNGKPGHIQFYSVHEDKQLYNLDIVWQNFVSPESLDKPLQYTKVTHVEFDEKGQWLATFEHWDDGQMTPEVRLKFWMYGEEKQSYILNTTAEQAHSDKIEALKFRPLSAVEDLSFPNMVVSSSIDGKFKIWTLTDDSDIYRENVKWICQSVGYYRDVPAGDMAFSEDGTLLAVVFGSCITLWDPDTNLLRETLVSNVKQSNLSHILFGSHNCSQYLVSCSDKVITVWNLINCSISWSVDYSVSCITKDPASDCMAVFNTEGHFSVFKPSDPNPVYKNKDMSPNVVMDCVFVPHSHGDLYSNSVLSWQEYSELYFIDKSQQLYSISFDGPKQKVKTKDDLIKIEENLPQSTLSLIMKGHTNTSALRVDQQKNITVKPQDKYLKEILGAPAHVQPSISTLCQPFLRSLLISAPNTSDNNDEEDREDIYKADYPISQTGSLDSGLDSDSDMDTTENQSTGNTPLKTGSESKLSSVAQSKHVNNDSDFIKRKSEVEKYKNNTHDSQSISNVFLQSLLWYSK